MKTLKLVASIGIGLALGSASWYLYNKYVNAKSSKKELGNEETPKGTLDTKPKLTVKPKVVLAPKVETQSLSFNGDSMKTFYSKPLWVVG